MKTTFNVEFECYHYNTGMGDNHHFTMMKEFDSLEEAEAFRNNLVEQRTKETEYSNRDITFEAFDEWKEQFGDKYFCVEDGYVSFSILDHPIITKESIIKEEIKS
jgi:hypothetical protein